MHKLYEYICDELKDLERKAETGQKLSMAEVEYMDKLIHTKKNLLKIEEMEDESEYSNAMNSYYERGSNRNNRSYARRRDSRGRYSRDGMYSMAGDMAEELRDLMKSAPDSQTRQEIQHIVSRLEQM